MMNRHLFKKNPRKVTCRGFSLLEVLITLIIVAIGLLGVAGMQVTSIKLNRVAESRSNGTIYATDILERIRANASNVGAYKTEFSNASYGTSTQAERDLNQWKASLSQLPSGEGRIRVSETDPSLCENPTVSRCAEVEITVRWTESNVVGGSANPQEFSFKTRI